MLSKGFKVFVGGLNYNTTDRSLAAYFERYGPLEDYIVIKTSEHKSRGFGFVIFQNVSYYIILSFIYVCLDTKLIIKIYIPINFKSYFYVLSLFY